MTRLLADADRFTPSRAAPCRVRIQERQRERPSLLGRDRVVAGARVAVKAVVGVGELHVDVILPCGLQRIHHGASLFRRNMAVASSPEEQYRRLQILYAAQQPWVHLAGRDAAAIVGNRALERQRDRGENRGASAHAIANCRNRRT